MLILLILCVLSFHTTAFLLLFRDPEARFRRKHASVAAKARLEVWSHIQRWKEVLNGLHPRHKRCSGFRSKGGFKFHAHGLYEKFSIVVMLFVFQASNQLHIH